MNFVKLYIGDYLRDTGTLTLAQHGAYALMLLEHYATEKPLPIGRELHRLLRADGKAERDAIDFVAAKYWTAQDGGLVNARAGKEIVRATHQREVNQEIGKRGGRPKRTEVATETETESVTESKRNRNPNQTPDTRHQTNTEPTVVPHHPAGGQASAGAVDFSDATGNAQPTQAGAVCRALRQAGISDTNPGHPRLLALLNAGATAAEFVGFAPAAIAKGAGFAWIIGAVEGERTRAAATAPGLHRGPIPTPAEARVAANIATAQRFLARTAKP